MKKITSLLMAVLMLAAMLSVFAVPASAEETYAAQGLCGSDGEVHWALSEDYETLTIWGNGNMINFDDWDETPWYPYDAYKKVKHLKIGIGPKDDITRIGSYAFAYFYYLESIELGDDVEFIEDYAFYQAPYYTSIDLVIPSTVFYIGQYAFSDARGLRNVYIKSDYDALPYYVKGETYHPVMGDDYINDYFLDHNGNFKADGVYIQYRAFYKCYNMETLTVGNTSKRNEKNLKIGASAFEKCSSLHTVHFADSLDTIDYAGFYACGKLKDLYYYGTEKKFKEVAISDYKNWNNDLRLVINGEGGRRAHYTTEGTYTYIDKNGNTATLDGSKTPCWILDSNIRELTGGWYIVNSEIKYTDRIYVTEDSNILLLDNCGIEAKCGIGVNNTALGIYAQSDDENTMGYIHASSSRCLDVACIGGDSGVKESAVMICGGNISAESGNNGSGIGSGKNGNCTVEITGGIVSGTGYAYGAGIGGGNATDKTKMSSDCTVTIRGGTVTGYGGDNAAGIGSGNHGDSTVYIYGGTVTGYGGDYAAGIGSGHGTYAAEFYEYALGNGIVRIYGGTVYAYGGCIGIGSGEECHCAVHILGGEITGDIGSGDRGSCSIDIGNDPIIHGGIGVGGPGTCTVMDNRTESVGSVLAQGNIWIIVAVAALALGGIAAMVIVKKKRKTAHDEIHNS